MALAHRAYAVFALTSLPLVAGLSSAQADPVFQVQTIAAGVHVTVTQEPASSLITASLFDDAIAYAASEFDTGGSSEALAASAFPGKLVVQGPELLCTQLFSCPAQPPPYPFLADASYPRRSKDSASASGQPMGGGPFVVTPLHANARAAADSNESSTAAGGSTILGGTPGELNIGASASTTSVQSNARRTVAIVTATVTDITLADVVHIASVRSTDRVVVAPGQPPVAHPSIAVAGVTVAGHSASIDDKGLHVDGAGGPSLTQRVSQRGVTIRTVGTRHQRTKNGSRSEATALRIDVALPVSGTPYIPNPLPPLPPPFDQIPALPGVNANGVYVGHITLGAVGAAAGVGIEPSFDLGGTGTGGKAETQPASTPTANGPSGPIGGNDLVNRLATPSTTTPPDVAGATGVLRGFVDLVSKKQVETLYAVLALGTLALFVGWRAATAIRAGRSR